MCLLLWRQERKDIGAQFRPLDRELGLRVHQRLRRGPYRCLVERNGFRRLSPSLSNASRSRWATSRCPSLRCSIQRTSDLLLLRFGEIECRHAEGRRQAAMFSADLDRVGPLHDLLELAAVPAASAPAMSAAMARTQINVSLRVPSTLFEVVYLIPSDDGAVASMRRSDLKKV